MYEESFLRDLRESFQSANLEDLKNRKSRNGKEASQILQNSLLSHGVIVLSKIQTDFSFQMTLHCVRIDNFLKELTGCGLEEDVETQVPIYEINYNY